MGAQGYIGRSPGDSSNIIARQTYTPTGITTNFTFASTYSVGYIDAYLNGVRLVEGNDFTATDGSVVGLTTHAQNGDIIELVAYKTFNATNVTAANNDFSVAGNLSVTGVSTFTGAITATGGITGAVTGDATGLSGTPDITIRNLTGVAATFTGVLSYDDVTNVDSVGFATFRSGINVQGAGSTTTTLNVTGVTTMTGDVNLGADFNIPDAITHVGDSNTKIRFPAADTFTVETAGSERVRVDSSGNVGINSTGQIRQLEIYHGTHATATLNSETQSSLFFSKPTDTNIGQISYDHGSDYMYFRVNDAERVRITSAGFVGINTAEPTSVFDVQVNTLAGINFTNQGQGAIIDFRANNVESAGRIRVGENGGGAEMLFHTKTTGDAITEAFRIDRDQRLLIGATAARTDFATTPHVQLEGDDFSTSSISITRNSNGNGRPTLFFGKSRGTTNGATTVVADDDGLGTIEFAGADGDQLHRAALIVAQVDATPGNNDMPGRLTFWTTPDGSTNPTERMRIDRQGRVGINDTTPDAQLDIGGDNADIRLGGSQYFRIKALSTGELTFNDNDLNERLRIDSSGRLLVGKQSHSGDALFVVETEHASGGIIGEFDNNNSGNFGGMRVLGGVTDRECRLQSLYGSSFFTFYTEGTGAATERLRIDSEGRVLIGEGLTSRTSGGINCHLHVEGTGANGSSLTLIRNTNGATNPPYLFFGKTRSSSTGGTTAVQSGDLLGYLGWQGADGNDLDGTAAAIQAKVDGTPGSNDMPGRLEFLTTADGNNSPVVRMKIDKSGKVFLNDITGNAVGGSTVKYNNSDKELRYDTSSRLLKTNITECTYGIETIKKLKPSRYNPQEYDKEGNITVIDQFCIGFIADEMVEDVPEVVHMYPKSSLTRNVEDTELVPAAISYDKLTPVLTKALQEAIVKIETLEQRLTDAGL
jgi:hypothetical protein